MGDTGVMTVGATEVCTVNSVASEDIAVVEELVVGVSFVLVLSNNDCSVGASTGVSSGLSGWIVIGVITVGTVPEDVDLDGEEVIEVLVVAVADVTVSDVVVSDVKLFKFGNPSKPLSS